MNIWCLNTQIPAGNTLLPSWSECCVLIYVFGFYEGHVFSPNKKIPRHILKGQRTVNDWSSIMKALFPISHFNGLSVHRTRLWPGQWCGKIALGDSSCFYWNVSFCFIFLNFILLGSCERVWLTLCVASNRHCPSLTNVNVIAGRNMGMEFLSKVKVLKKNVFPFLPDERSPRETREVHTKQPEPPPPSLRRFEVCTLKYANNQKSIAPSPLLIYEHIYTVTHTHTHTYTYFHPFLLSPASHSLSVCSPETPVGICYWRNIIQIHRPCPHFLPP